MECTNWMLEELLGDDKLSGEAERDSIARREKLRAVRAAGQRTEPRGETGEPGAPREPSEQRQKLIRFDFPPDATDEEIADALNKLRDEATKTNQSQQP